MSVIEVQDAFTQRELEVVEDAAAGRGMTIWEYIHETVIADVLRDLRSDVLV